MSSLTEKIELEISPLVKSLGCIVVRVAILGRDRNRTLQIMIEKEDGSSATIMDCEKVSRALSVKLDVMDPIKNKYRLEVSSTGIDRPLVKPTDFIRFQGKPVVVETYTAKAGRKTFKGLLDFASENDIKLSLDSCTQDGNDTVTLLYEEISNAHIDGFKV